jgi:hypothetical protein
MKFQACGGLEGSLIEDDAGARIRWLKRQKDYGLLVVGIGFFIDEREDEAAWSLDSTEGAADVEDISIWRLHDDSVIPTLHRIELKARNGESGGTPPTPDLLSVNERRKDTLRGHDEDLLQVESRPAGVVWLVHAVDHAKSTAASGVIPEHWPSPA